MSAVVPHRDRAEVDRETDRRRERHVHIDVWTDLRCGCSRTRDGWWIVSTACDEHLDLIPRVDLENMPPSWFAKGRQYGPFKPVRRRRPRGGDA